MGIFFLILFLFIFLIICSRLNIWSNSGSTNMINKLKSNKSNKKEPSLIKVIFLSLLLSIVILDALLDLANLGIKIID